MVNQQSLKLLSTRSVLMICAAYHLQLLGAEPLNIEIPANFNLSSQPLGNALKQFAMQTGKNIVFDKSIVSDKVSPHVKGNYTEMDALKRMLENSGLEAVLEEKTIVIRFARPPTAKKAESLELDKVELRAKRFYEVGPLPGLGLTKEEIPGNVQSINAQQIRESQALSLSELMNSTLQSVNVNDYQGNPFMMDVTYRGFTAGPQVGTPQGLSVFFDGIRVNEPFGDVVNWDMIPMGAIASFDVFPGSNPIFGLNTLGGALSVKTKSGFDYQEGTFKLTGGSFERKQLQMEVGGNNGNLAGFVAANIFNEAGWRQNSPSKVNQLFGKTEWRADKFNIGISALYAGNEMVGNGLIPVELYKSDPTSVFTSPDETKNRLFQMQLAAAFEVSETFNITSQLYQRNSKRNTVNGDFYRGFEEMDNVFDLGRETPTQVNNLPLCQLQDINRDGLPDFFVDQDFNGIQDSNELTNDAGDGSTGPTLLAPLNNPTNATGVCNFSTEAGLNLATPRNGAKDTNGTGTGVVNGTPIGQIDRTAIYQVTRGGSMQFNWHLPHHKLMTGFSFDSAYADYASVSRLALIDASHRVYLDPSNINPTYFAASNDITNNAFDGTSKTSSLYFSETWTPTDTLSVSASARYNKTDVTNNLKSRTGAGFSALHNLRDFGAEPNIILCQDPNNCPTEPNATTKLVAAAINNGNGYYRPDGNFGARSSLDGIKETFSYYSLNPSIGASFSPSESINTYANWSQGTRVPSVIELGCAYSNDPKLQSGGTCTLPTQLSGDPYMPQIKATTSELGIRGVFANQWRWNMSLYQTDLKDDIYFTSLSASRNYFDTIGDTRRKGVEMGLSGTAGPLDFSFNYALTSATFESPFHMFNLANSSTNFDPNNGNGPGLYPYEFSPDGNSGTVIFPKNPAYVNKYGQSSFRQYKVEPGNRMPGIPLHNLNASVVYRINDRWQMGLNMILRSSAIARGNENNQHRKGPAAQQIGQLDCNPFFDPSTGDFSGFFQCDATPSTTVGQPFTQDGSTPGFAIFNFKTTYKIDKALTLGLQINNIFDRDYYSGSRLGANPFSPSINGAIGSSGFNYNSRDWQNTNFVAPGAPRSAWLTLTYDFDTAR